jgi:hypothetical protein
VSADCPGDAAGEENFSVEDAGKVSPALLELLSAISLGAE